MQLRHPARNRCDSGFTVAEVVIAALLLGIFWVTMYTAFTMGFKMVQQSRENMRATQILTRKMETIRLYTWEQLVTRTDYFPRAFVDKYDPTAGTNNTVYGGRVSLDIPATLPSVYRTNMRLVTISVFWTNFYRGEPMVFTKQMQTHVSLNGMQNYIFNPTNL